MASPHSKTALPHSVSAMLSRLKRQIRAYVALDGLARLVTWLIAAYWIGLAIDYLPVAVGSTELPRAARLVLLILVSTVAAFLLMRYVVWRIIARITPQSLALLLERRYPELDDTLITAVATTPEANSANPELHEAMLARAVTLAEQRARTLDTRQVLNYRPLARNLAFALMGVASFVGFALVAQDAFAIWTRRYLLLSDELWPRRAYVEVLDFAEGHRKIAEGNDLVIRVRAAADRATPPPQVCTIYYQTDGGERGRVHMSLDGDPSEGFQYYRYEGQPFQGMLEGVEFDVVGLDYRARGYRVDVVASPSIVELNLVAELPAYLAQPTRREQWRPGLSLPAGSTLTLQGRASKRLQQVRVASADSADEALIDVSGDSENFEFSAGRLDVTTTWQFELLDTDDVQSEQPYRVTINAMEDLPPQVEISLRGIGTAITPQATIPVGGQITDDYQVKSSWFQVDVPDKNITRRVDLPTNRIRPLDQSLDLRAQRADAPADWELAAGDKVVFSVRALDAYDLDDTPHLGQSDDLPLDVVTPDELLALLEARELNLKRRFEQTLSELVETRDGLLKLTAELLIAQEPPKEPERSTNENTTLDSETQVGTGADSVDPARDATLRLLRAQRAQQQAAKAQQEVDGVAASFADIREELINNRVDTPERNERLQTKIIDPLNEAVGQAFPAWLQQLAELEQQLNSPDTALPTAQLSVERANEIILVLQAVLDNMLELESYNELIDLVRSILSEQESLQKDTEAERKRAARALLEE